MSEQWEVVSKSRKQKNLDKKVSAHNEQKRIAAQLPKLEELCKNLLKGAPCNAITCLPLPFYSLRSANSAVSQFVRQQQQQQQQVPFPCEI